MINDNRLTSKNKFEFPIDKMNDKIKKFREIPASKSQYPNIVFLGTSAAKSERFRNVSCIFLQFSQSNSMIMDCGEGSYFQLVNHFGINKI